MLTTIILIALAVDRAVQIVLKVVAPKTKTTVDDKILVYAEDAEKVLEGLGGGESAAAQGLTIVPKA